MLALLLKILGFIAEFVIGIFGKGLKNKLLLRRAKKSAQKELKLYLANQIDKQKKTAKYIPDIFVENYDAKETCRFFAVPKRFWEKTIWDISSLNFNHLNRQLHKIGIKSFDVALPKQLLISSDVDSLQQQGESLCKLLQEKIEYLEHMRAAKRGDLNGIVPPDKVEDAQKQWHLITSPLWANYRNLEEIKENIVALKSRIVLITSRAGKGKTNFVCDFAEKVLRRRNVPCIFFTARDFDYDLDNMLGYCLNKIFPDRSGLTITEKFEILKEFSQKDSGFFIIIIDGLNESRDIGKFSSKLEEFTQTLLQHNFIKIILTCRSEYFEYRFDNLEKSSFAENILRVDNLEMRECEEAKLIDKYFDFFKLSYNTIYGNAYHILSQNPLLLRFYCEVQGDPNSQTYRSLGTISNIHTDRLFEEYLKKKIDSIACVDHRGKGIPLGYVDQFRGALKALIEYMVTKNEYMNISISQIDKQHHKLINRLIGEDIILREDIIQPPDMSDGCSEAINFTFDEFRDFLIADYLVKTVWPSDKKKFNDFTDNLIKVEKQKFNGKTRFLYRPSVIAEGVGKFIFQIARHKCLTDLEQAVKSKEWYKWTYLDAVFSIEDEHVKDEDISFIKKEFLTGIQNSSLICYQLIQRYNTSEYKVLNIDVLYGILRKLDYNQYIKLVNPIFSNYVPHYRRDHFTWKIDSLVKHFRKKLDNKGNLNLFELLIFLFVIPSKNYWSPALGLFDEFTEKHTGKAVEMLLRNIRIAHLGIRIHIWEKLEHLLEKGQQITQLKDLVQDVLTELKSETKTEYNFDIRLAQILLTMSEVEAGLLSVEESDWLQGKLKSNGKDSFNVYFSG